MCTVIYNSNVTAHNSFDKSRTSENFFCMVQQLIWFFLQMLGWVFEDFGNTFRYFEVWCMFLGKLDAYLCDSDVIVLHGTNLGFSKSNCCCGHRLFIVTADILSLRKCWFLGPVSNRTHTHICTHMQAHLSSNLTSTREKLVKPKDV